MDTANFFKPIVIFLALATLTLILQFNIFFNQDISWLMHAGQRLLAGGNYLQDFFEPDPPMSIFLYLPAVLLAKLFNFNFLISSLIYIYAITIISWGICFKLASIYFKDSEKNLYFFMVSLSFVYLLLAGEQIGEREHLMFLLVMPYLLTISLSQQKLPLGLALTTGFLAGIGFVIKPYFLLTFIIMESYLMIRRKNLLTWLRPEIFIIVLVGFSYFFAMLVFTPDYITKVMPLLIKYYYIGFSQPWYLVVSNGTVLFSVFSCVIYLALRHYCRCKNIMDILVLATVVFLIEYGTQRAIWYYHIIPALSTATLLLTTLASDLFTNPTNIALLSASNHKNKITILHSFFMVFLLFPIITASYHLIGAVAGKQHSTRYQFIELFNDHAKGDSVYFFSDLMTPLYPLVDYSHTISASRYPCLWMFLSIELKSHKPLNTEERTNLYRDQKLFVNTVIEDLMKHSPALIFVQLKSPNWNRDINVSVNYLKIFSQDPRFKSIWENYEFLEVLGDYAVYKKI